MNQILLTISFLLLLTTICTDRLQAQIGSEIDVYGPVLQTVFAEAETEAATAKKAAIKKKPGPKPVLDYEIYRDRNPLPIDPRKPCQPCLKRQGCSCSKCCQLHETYGFQGRPYREREPGGCLCGKNHERKKKRPFFSVYWPSVCNAICEEHHPNLALRKQDPCRFRLSSLFDNLGGFELLPCYERPDNGYSGPWRDRYGCLGESKFLNSQVSGVDFRLPGQPVSPGGVIEYP